MAFNGGGFVLPDCERIRNELKYSISECAEYLLSPIWFDELAYFRIGETASIVYDMWKEQITTIEVTAQHRALSTYFKTPSESLVLLIFQKSNRNTQHTRIHTTTRHNSHRSSRTSTRSGTVLNLFRSRDFRWITTNLLEVPPNLL